MEAEGSAAMARAAAAGKVPKKSRGAVQPRSQRNGSYQSPSEFHQLQTSNEFDRTLHPAYQQTLDQLIQQCCSQMKVQLAHLMADQEALLKQQDEGALAGGKRKRPEASPVHCRIVFLTNDKGLSISARGNGISVVSVHFAPSTLPELLSFLWDWAVDAAVPSQLLRQLTQTASMASSAATTATGQGGSSLPVSPRALTSHEQHADASRLALQQVPGLLASTTRAKTLWEQQHQKHTAALRLALQQVEEGTVGRPKKWLRKQRQVVVNAATQLTKKHRNAVLQAHMQSLAHIRKLAQKQPSRKAANAAAKDAAAAGGPTAPATRAAAAAVAAAATAAREDSPRLPGGMPAWLAGSQEAVVRDRIASAPPQQQLAATPAPAQPPAVAVRVSALAAEAQRAAALLAGRTDAAAAPPAGMGAADGPAQQAATQPDGASEQAASGGTDTSDMDISHGSDADPGGPGCAAASAAPQPLTRAAMKQVAAAAIAGALQRNDSAAAAVGASPQAALAPQLAGGGQPLQLNGQDAPPVPAGQAAAVLAGHGAAGSMQGQAVAIKQPSPPPPPPRPPPPPPQQPWPQQVAPGSVIAVIDLTGSQQQGSDVIDLT